MRNVILGASAAILFLALLKFIDPGHRSLGSQPAAVPVQAKAPAAPSLLGPDPAPNRNELALLEQACGRPERIKPIAAEKHVRNEDVFYPHMDFVFTADAKREWTMTGAFLRGRNDTVDLSEAKTAMPCITKVHFRNPSFQN